VDWRNPILGLQTGTRISPLSGLPVTEDQQ